MAPVKKKKPVTRKLADGTKVKVNRRGTKAVSRNEMKGTYSKSKDNIFGGNKKTTVKVGPGGKATKTTVKTNRKGKVTKKVTKPISSKKTNKVIRKTRRKTR